MTRYYWDDIQKYQIELQNQTYRLVNRGQGTEQSIATPVMSRTRTNIGIDRLRQWRETETERRRCIERMVEREVTR